MAERTTRRSGDDPAEQPRPAGAPEPTPADGGALRAPVTQAEEDPSGRVKVTREWALGTGARHLGVPQHVVVGALAEDDREELTINALRKTVDEWLAKPQNPEQAEEA